MNATMVYPGLLRAVRVSICGSLLMAVLLPASTFAESKPQDPALQLQTLEDLHSATQTLARKPVSDVEEGYRYALEEQQKTAQAAGDLKSVLAAKQAVTDLDTGRPPLISDDLAVAAIQKAYFAQRQKAGIESEQALAKADQDHLTSLKRLVVELTKTGDIEQAQIVQGKVDVLVALLKSKVTPAQSTAGVQEIEIWKSKAQEEFPALKDPTSPLSKQIKAAMEQKKATPTYFKNPQWPYLLAKENHEALVQQETFQRIQGVYGETSLRYIFSVDDAGNVVGFQLKNEYFSEILGKIANQSFTSKWVQSISNIPHEMTYTLQKDSNISANGSFRSGNRVRYWNGTLKKIHDKAECIRVLDLAASLAKKEEHRTAIAKIKDSYLREKP